MFDAPPPTPRDWFVSFVSLVDAQDRPTYDVLRMMVDTGAVFRAGTTEVVACIVQFAVEGADKRVAEAVEAALFELKAKGRRA